MYPVPGRPTRTEARLIRTLFLALCLVMVAGDLAQPLLYPWTSRYWGALGGAAIYGGTAAAVASGWVQARWIVVVLPALPTVLLAGWLANQPVPVEPDAWMISLWLVQLTIAALGLRGFSADVDRQDGAG